MYLELLKRISIISERAAETTKISVVRFTCDETLLITVRDIATCTSDCLIVNLVTNEFTCSKPILNEVTFDVINMLKQCNKYNVNVR